MDIYFSINNGIVVVLEPVVCVPRLGGFSSSHNYYHTNFDAREFKKII